MKHRAQHRLPWWGHIIVLTLIVGGSTISVVTGNPIYAVVLVPVAWFIGARLQRATVRVADEAGRSADLKIESTGHAYVIASDGSRVRTESR